MKYRGKDMVDVSRRVFTLRHLETGEYVCLRQNSREYLAAFTNGDAAIQFREELGMVEFVDICSLRLGDAPFHQFWLDGEMISRTMLTDRKTRSAG